MAPAGRVLDGTLVRMVWIFGDDETSFYTRDAGLLIFMRDWCGLPEEAVSLGEQRITGVVQTPDGRHSKGDSA